jgi:hypothetical protein
LILKKEHTIVGVENRLLSRILGPKTDEIMEDWRKIRDE